MILVMAIGLQVASGAPPTVREFDWSAEARAGRLPVTGVSTGLVAGRSVLRIVNDKPEALQVRLLTVVDPGVTQRVFAVAGEVRYEGVEGEGYLEMWSCFPALTPGGQEPCYFSRTLGEGGAMGKISGRSDWRAFELKFDRLGASAPPQRLEVNLRLPGRGVVDVGPARLVAYRDGPGDGAFAGQQSTAAWWSNRTGGWIGAILGSTWGLFGALAGVLVSRGRARTFVVRGFAVMLAMGVLLTLAGVVAAAVKQPHAVWFSLFLPGVLALALVPGQLGHVRRRYADLELRRMLAEDAPQDP